MLPASNCTGRLCRPAGGDRPPASFVGDRATLGPSIDWKVRRPVSVWRHSAPGRNQGLSISRPDPGNWMTRLRRAPETLPVADADTVTGNTAVEPPNNCAPPGAAPNCVG
jgi:hypothetical protein